MQFDNQFRKELNKLCRELDRDYYINMGGCCFVAQIIAECLSEFNIPYKLVVFDWVKKDKKEVKYELSNQISGNFDETSITGAYTCNHYCIKIDSGFINVGGYNKIGRHQHSFDNIDPETIAWIYETGNWNDTYDTDYNSEIIDIIYNFFKEYEAK